MGTLEFFPGGADGGDDVGDVAQHGREQQQPEQQLGDHEHVLAFAPRPRKRQNFTLESAFIGVTKAATAPDDLLIITREHRSVPQRVSYSLRSITLNDGSTHAARLFVRATVSLRQRAFLTGYKVPSNSVKRDRSHIFILKSPQKLFPTWPKRLRPVRGAKTIDSGAGPPDRRAASAPADVRTPPSRLFYAEASPILNNA
ncbi:hypothetical protein EVAR_47249_1 [Eumeta japonica]|uniref:Uncharacterized protein n=1 Tax=Eumeta variegata TaxID=151549 RepID=A0A4C1XIP3_EUMVA|nr:hypothetical protein EVAR_47249_1 [Eumeta japonica]